MGSFRQFFKNPSARVGVLILLVIILACLFSSHLVPYSPYDQNLQEKLLRPSLAHLMGTDEFGRDVFCRILVGAQYSLSSGLVSVLLTLVGGLLIGLPAG